MDFHSGTWTVLLIVNKPAAAKLSSNGVVAAKMDVYYEKKRPRLVARSTFDWTSRWVGFLGGERMAGLKIEEKGR